MSMAPGTVTVKKFTIPSIAVPTALLIASHADVTKFRKPSFFCHSMTRPATNAAIPAMINVTGLNATASTPPSTLNAVLTAVTSAPIANAPASTPSAAPTATMIGSSVSKLSAIQFIAGSKTDKILSATCPTSVFNF